MRTLYVVPLSMLSFLSTASSAGESAVVDFSTDSLGCQVRKYTDGTAYVWLGLQSIRLPADMAPSPH